MKKILFLLPMFLLAFNIYNKKESYFAKDLEKKHLQLITKVSAEGVIHSSDLHKNLILIATYKKVKVFDVKTNSVIKTFNFDNKVVKAKFYKDKVVILTSNELFIFSKDYKLLTSIKDRNFEDFDIKKDILALYKRWPLIRIIDLRTGEELAKINKFANFIELSKNAKKLLVCDNYNVYIYDIKGELLNRLKINYLKKAKWLDDDFVIATLKNGIYKIDTIKGSINKIIDMKAFSIYPLDLKNVLVSKKNIYNLNLDLSKITKVYTTNLKDAILNLAIDNKLLMAQTTDEVYIYSFLNKENNIKKVIKTDEIKKDTKSDKKPTLKLYVSKTKGTAPLEVKIKIYAFDDGKIIAYYLNVNGKEYLYEDANKVITYTFDEPGEYKIFAAVKDNNNNVTTKTITIEVKEESFDDFKAQMLGK